MKFLSLLILSTLLLTGTPTQALAQSQRIQNRSTLAPNDKAWKWADKMLKKMSVEEKVGQIIYIGINAKFTNQDSDYFRSLKRDVVDNHVGGILLFGAPVYES